MLSFGFWEPVLIFTLINVIMVSGLYITALSGQISMATAAFAGIGGYVSAVLTTNFDWPFLPALLLAAVVGGVLGCVLAVVTLRMKDFVLKLTTLAFGEAMSVVAFNTKYIGGANGFSGIPLYTTLSTVLIVTLATIYVAWRVDESRVGLGARAARDDALAAASMGVSIGAARLITFGVGSAIIGLGGALSTHYVLVIVPSQLGFFYSLAYIIFLLAGGIHTLWGPILAAVLLTGIPEFLRFASEYRLSLYGIVIIAVVMWRPEGLITRMPKGVARWSRRRAGAEPR